tara:strand:- start:901 stop:1401 length:501 start_codon:yes stop_codon:yes gene_type:complete
MKDKDNKLIYESYVTENNMLIVASQWMDMLVQDAEQGYPREDTVKVAHELMDKYGVDKEVMVAKMREIGKYDEATINDIVDASSDEAEEAYKAGTLDRQAGVEMKPALTTFGKYADYYYRGYKGEQFDRPPERSEEEKRAAFNKAYGPELEDYYHGPNRSNKRGGG